MWTLKTIILLLAGLAWSSALSNFQCARYCKEENGSFGYEAGKAYTYKYSGSARSLVNTTTNNVPDQSGLNIDCIVVFRLVSNCDYVMEILGATISDYYIKNTIKSPPSSGKFRHLETTLKERPLHFAFNGKIDTICPDKNEIKEIIDIKRGILSVFQMSNAQFKRNALVYETDITGNCETHYKVTTSEGIKRVNKTKNIDACDHRMSQYLSWQTVPYMTNANSKSLPLLKSTLNCQLNYGPTDEINGDILHDSQCHEKHVFQPFSNGDNGAVTIIEQEMRFVSSAPSQKVFNGPKDVMRSTLIYEYNTDNMQLKDSMPAVMLLKELESKTADGVDMDVPSVFSKLVLEFQGLSKTSLLEIFSKLNQKQRKFYIDAISLITTTAGVEVMSELYENKKLDDAQMNTWLVSVNFIKNPSKNILKAIYPMTLIPKIRRNAMLALSSILYKYCNKHSNCLDDVVILEMVKNIEKPLINNCLVTSAYSKMEIFLALKSIGNAGVTTSFYNLQSCYLSNELPIELRLAAIAAHRRVKCADNENLDDFKALFANPRANSEVRIASYLASMQCASYASFAQVKDVLVKEEANQVGSFIWTHLTNLQETSVPGKQGIRKLLENEFLQNKFQTDIRKYSRNYEASTFFDSVGAGGEIEANVIFTSESYLPRSAMLNFTLDLFGETINVFEFGARAEGFEDIVENLFATDGYFSDGNVHSYISNAKKGYAKQQRIDEFGEVFKVLPKEPSGSVYAKIFGNEISFAQFYNLQDLFGMPPNSGKVAMDVLMKFIKQNDIDYTKSFSFLDAKYKIPTIIGFPMQLKANGTATVGLTAGGEINFKELRNYKMLVKGKIYPSVSVQVTSTMSLDTYAGETGVQFIGSLKSNMYIDGYANMEMGKIVDIKVNVPKKQMDIFTVSSDVYVIHSDHSYPIQDSSTIVDNSEYCTAGYVSKLVGLQFCNQWRFVNASSIAGTPNFPLTGSFKYSLHIKKTDAFDFYQLYLETQLSNPDGQYLVNFVIDTPQSKIDRKLQCLLAADLKAYKVSAQIYSPFANFQLHSNIERELPKYKFTLTTMFNNKEVVALLSTFDVRDEGEMVTYEPVAKINYKQQQVVAVTGKLSHVKAGEYRADLKLVGLTKEVAQIYGTFSCGADYLQVKTNIMSTNFNGDLDATLSGRPNDAILESVLNYNYKNNVKENVSFSGRYNKSATESLSRNMLSLHVKASEWPSYNTHLQWQNQRGRLYFNNTAKGIFFGTIWTSRQIVKLDKGFQDEEPDLVLLADLTCPENNIDYRSELSFNSSKKHLRTRALFQLNKVQRAEALVDYNSKSTEDTAHVLFYYAQQAWTIDGELNRYAMGMYNFDVECRYQAFDKEHVILTMHGDYKNASLGDVQNHKLNCTLDLPESEGEWCTPWIVTSTVQKSHATFLSQSKLTTKEGDYAGHLNWIEDALAISVQADDKPLFVVNGARNEEFASVALALNIHQHFELNAKLVLPYQRFNLQVYWDKDRDENQRFLFSIEQNAFKGQYKMEIEYPNQKITTNIILIPTQVIMNVTWGVEVSQRIYLKIGNKYYDVGGIWFGELETPFRYLEKQQFHLQYAVVSDSFDVHCDLSWRSHHINLLISGSKTSTNLNGNLQLNTTLPEIRKVGATLSHAHHIADNDYRSDAAFDYNDHSIRAHSNWRMTGYRVDSTFRVDSPTRTIAPIFGMLTLNDDANGDDANDMDFVLSWQEKNITASYAFKSDASFIEIDTPFPGIEKTLLKYAVVTHADTVFLSTVVDIFKQNNSITFSWANTDGATTFWLDLMSPMTGRYYGYFTHSGLLDRLKENFRIQGPEDKDIIQIKIEGDIMPALEMNVTVSLILLDHDAQLTITNSREPLLSTVVAVWNERTINSKISIHFNDTRLSFFNWLIESNLFAPAKVSYQRDHAQCHTTVELPNNYKLDHRYTYAARQNELYLCTPGFTLDFDQIATHHELNQKLIVNLGDQRIICRFSALIDDSSLDLKLTYNFYQVEDIFRRVSSYNISTYLSQSATLEKLNFEVSSTSFVNGKMDIEYIKGGKLSDSSIHANLNFPAYWDYELEAKHEIISWRNRLSNKVVELSYICNDEYLDSKLVSTYEEIPSANLHMSYSNMLILRAEVKEYQMQLSSDKQAKNITMTLKRNTTELAHVLMAFIGVKQLNASFLINMNRKYDAEVSYIVSGTIFELMSHAQCAENKVKFQSKFNTDAKLFGAVEFQFNEDFYSSKIQHSGKYLDLHVITPLDEYTGKLHIGDTMATYQAIELELSSRISSNYITFVRNLNHLKLSAASEYFHLPTQEITFVWDTWRNFSGEGFYTNSKLQRHKFLIQSKSFNDWSFAYYLPDEATAYVDLNVTGRFESESDFDALIEGNWEGHKIKFDVKNYFGSYYQTTFNLITPVKGWARTGFDCTLNERKIGLALAVRNHHMSIVARRTGGELLRVEYLGETLLEVSSGEGHMTLRTTTYFGKYRLFIQGTQTPGIYVFSLLKDGENLISFMLQNYSINDVVHYKGKLMAPEIMPQNSTLCVEFKAHSKIWELLEFRMKKDHRPLLELAWENNKLGDSYNGFLLFQSQIENLPNFKLKPKVKFDQGVDVDIELRYPCEGSIRGECSIAFEFNPRGMACHSVSSIDRLNFHMQSHFMKLHNLIAADFTFNDFKSCNVAINATVKPSDYVKISGLANFVEESLILQFDVLPSNIKMEFSTNHKGTKHYFLAKSQLHNENLLIDLDLPPSDLLNMSISARANVSLRNGLITVKTNNDKYEMSWYSNKTPNDLKELSVVFKENAKQIADFSFRNTLSQNNSIQSDTYLHATYKDQTIDTFLKGFLSDDSLKVTFTLFSPFESIERVNFVTAVQHSADRLLFEQFLQLPSDEFVLNASATSNRKGHTLRLHCKPLNNKLINKTINAKYAMSLYNKSVYVFDVDLGDDIYKVNAYPTKDGYKLELKSGDVKVAYLKFKRDSLNFRIKSLGIIKNFLLQLDNERFIVASEMFNYQKVFFSQPGAFGMIINEIGKVHRTVQDSWTIIYKIKGSMPEINFDLAGGDDSYSKCDVLLLVGGLDHMIKFSMDIKGSKLNHSLQLQAKNKVLNASLEENHTTYSVSFTNEEKLLGTFRLNKDLTSVSNDIYIPFGIKVQNNTIEASSNMGKFIFGPKQQLIHINFHENQTFQYEFLFRDNIKIYYRRNEEKLVFILGRNHNFEFNLNDRVSLKYDLDDRFLSKFNYKVKDDFIKCTLTADSIHNITFLMQTDDELSVLLRSYFDQSNIMYQLKIPKWNLLRLFDIALSWESSNDVKIFGASVQMDSDHTGLTKAGTIFELRPHLLDIESHFTAPFLEGFETFYGKVYIPKEFKPYIEFALPKQTYKLYYNHSDNFMDAGIVCKDKNFSLVINNNNSKNITIHVVLPNERFRTFLFRHHGQDLEVNFNDVYAMNFTSDLTFLNVQTPHQGYERFGYRFKRSLATSHQGELSLRIVHPEYDTPLGMDFKYNVRDQHFDMVYNIHIPFTIDGYDYVAVNITSEILPNGVNIQMNTLSNNLDVGFTFGFDLTDEKKTLSAQSHLNEVFYIGKLNIEPSKVYLILGDPHKAEMRFLESFPDFDSFVSSNLNMVYVSLSNNKLDLLVHNSIQPFSIRRASNTFGKLIWDLRRSTETVIGALVTPNVGEFYFADNKIIFGRHISPNKTNLNVNLQINERRFEYTTKHLNLSKGINSESLISLRQLITPLGGFAFRKHTSRTNNSLKDSMELNWGTIISGRNNSNLMFNYEITPGTLVSTVTSTLLPNDMVLKVDMSKFRSIPSIFEASFAYSSNVDKTIQFRMYYNKSYDNDCVMTDRAFLLKHSSSMIDYEVYFNAMRMPEFSNGSVILKYKDFDSNMDETMRASMRVDHNRFGVYGEVMTNKNRLHFMATSTSVSKRYGFLVNIEVNNKDPLNLECNYDFGHESPSASLMAAYGTSRKYVFYAGLPNEKEITAKLGHEIYGKPSLDALAIVKLNTSQLLWVKVLWKDNLYAPFHEAIVDEYNDLRYVIEATGRQLVDVIHDDVGKEFVKDFAEIKQTIVNYTMEEVTKAWKVLLSHDLPCTANDSSLMCEVLHENDELRQLGELIVENFEFLLDIIGKMVEASLKSIRILFGAVNDEIDRAMKDIKNIQNIKVDAKAILKRGINTARKSLKEMEDIVVKLLDDFDKYICGLQDQVEDFFEPFLSLIDDFIAYCEQRLAMLQIGVLDTLDSIQQYIFNLREIKAMFSVYYSYINWLEELHIIDMLEPVGDVIEEILETIIKDVKRVLDHYKPYLDALGDAIFGKYDGINQLPPIVEVREHVNRIYHKTIWVWNYHNMTEGLKQCVKKFSKDIDSVLSFIEVDELSSTEDLEYPFGYNYVIRPENRLIEIGQPLPVEWKAFNKTPSFEHYPLYERIQGKSEQFIKFYKSRYDLIDMLENFVIDLYEPSISPSTRNYAMIIGKSQYLTFNGLNYNFLSNCSYLLASDFKSKSFSLIVNYRNNSGTIDKSYEILTNDSSFEIFSEEVITLNGRKVDLPIVHKQVTITRETMNIVAESSRGFKMICYFHFDYCTVQLSGWLFGKTAGLLGTLDNEQHTDSLSSRRLPSANIAEFLHSWQLQPQCELIESPNLQPDVTDYVGHMCDLLFNNTHSPLAVCFDAVEPGPFAEICFNEIKANPDVKACAPAAAYVHRCRQAKVAIRMPDFCVTCNDGIGYSEEILDGHNNKTVDVVFLNELDCYNATAITAILPKLLDEDLNRMRFGGNRFASVGYGGYTLPKPHVYTHDGKIWSSSANMDIKLQLDERNLNAKSKFTAIDALKYAASLEYRIGVPKLFILTQCEIATDVSNSPDIYNMLGVKDITLHVLKPSAFGNQTNILGLDMNELLPTFNPFDVNHNQIINQIDDVYSGLALSTNGTIFDLRKVHEDGASATLWARTITKHVQRSPCQKCMCMQDFNGVGKIECSRCLAPAVKQFLNEYEEGHKMKFNDGDDSDDSA